LSGSCVVSAGCKKLTTNKLALVSITAEGTARIQGFQFFPHRGAPNLSY